MVHVLLISPELYRRGSVVQNYLFRNKRGKRKTSHGQGTPTTIYPEPTYNPTVEIARIPVQVFEI